KARNVLAMAAATPTAAAAPVLAAAVPATVAATAVVTDPMLSSALPGMLDLDSDPPSGGGASGPLW
ncbi:MAG: peptidase M15A, partial [Methanobacteriota archaeon]